MAHGLRIASATLLVSLSLLFGPTTALAIGVKLNPASGHPSVGVVVKGTGFGANEGVDIFFDTGDVRFNHVGN